MTNTVATTAVELREVAIPSAPDSGLVVLAGSSVPMSAVCEPTNAVLDSASCDWFLGRRRGDASYDEWRMVADDEQGVDFNCTMESGGIYRVKVEMALEGETRETFFKVNARDALDPPPPYFEIGGYDHIGVASHEWQIQLRNVAFSHIGETQFALATELPSYYGYRSVAPGRWKCNAFVAYCICQTGLTIPRNTSALGRVYPPSAND